jgi:hypothetical protein
MEVIDQLQIPGLDLVRVQTATSQFRVYGGEQARVSIVLRNGSLCASFTHDNSMTRNS